MRASRKPSAERRLAEGPAALTQGLALALPRRCRPRCRRQPRILDRLEASIPNAVDRTAFLATPFELLVATILSAQCTDAARESGDARALRSLPDARARSRSADAGRTRAADSTDRLLPRKARSLIGMAQAVVDEARRRRAGDMDALVALPGVGRKTANVVRGHAFGLPGLPVDRHVLRVANRIGLAQSDDPEKVGDGAGRAAAGRRAGPARRTR